MNIMIGVSAVALIWPLTLLYIVTKFDDGKETDGLIDFKEVAGLKKSE